MSDRDLMLAGKHVMIVDDEPLLAFDLSDVLIAHGGHVVGPFHTVSEAINEVGRDEKIDLAMLDVHVGTDIVWPLAKELRDKDMDFIFVSAVCTTEEIPPEFRDVPFLRKPLQCDELRKTLENILE